MAIRPRNSSSAIVNFIFLSMLLFCSLFALGEGTHAWEQSSFGDLSKGTAKGVAIRGTGGLELSPAFKPLATTPSTYIWAIAADSSGNVYAAAGAPARIYRITPDGKSFAIFQPQELQVQALALDKNGVIYAATNPDGKVYRIVPPSAAKDLSAPSAWHASLFLIRVRNTFGTWRLIPLEIFMWRLAIMERFSA